MLRSIAEAHAKRVVDAFDKYVEAKQGKGHMATPTGVQNTRDALVATLTTAFKDAAHEA